MPVPFIKLPEPPKDPLPHFVEESPGWKIAALCVERAFRLLNLCVWVPWPGDSTSTRHPSLPA